MHLNKYSLVNFRRLEGVEIHLDPTETIYVGPNNSGKTSATTAFRLFVTQTKEFKIHDFSAPLLKKIDTITASTKADAIPSIDFDLWFSIDSDIEYGKVGHLLPSLSALYSEIGLRISYSVDNPVALFSSYKEAQDKRPQSGQNAKKSVSDYLGEPGNLKRFFSLKYYKLEKQFDKTEEEKDIEKILAHPIDKDEGRNALSLLVRIDFVDAQRSIDDLESSKSSRLSNVLADYYSQNLRKPENNHEAISVLDKNNEALSSHYEGQFKNLIETIGDLGFPSVNDRDLRILSTLNPENALRGNTTLLYAEKDSDHQLPEAYNGLGFKNLIFIAIQISHFQNKWIASEINRPLCHLIFVEEPEVHLHAQVQQAFIKQIRGIITRIAKDLKHESSLPQLVLSTHSSHILDTAEFTSIRYFQRIPTQVNGAASGNRKSASKVLNLAKFNTESNDKENLEFLKKYLKLTHCDLFFSDAAILIEGSAERLLLPKFIEKNNEELQSAYLTILEIGGAYTHKLLPLMNFLSLPTLIVTDIDSVDPANGRTKCRADKVDAVTSNSTITTFTNKKKISELIQILQKDRVFNDKNTEKFLTFQRPVAVSGYEKKNEMIPRTFEESFIYHNLSLVRDKKLEVYVTLASPPDYEKDYEEIFNEVNSQGYKKVEFALNQIDSKEDWVTPEYIAEGLAWLSKTLGLEAKAKPRKGT